MDKYEEFACDLKNEAACEEELDAEELNFRDVETEHYEEDEY
jgi:hypothetical protein